MPDVTADEAGILEGSLVQGQPELHSKTLFQNLKYE